MKVLHTKWLISAGFLLVILVSFLMHGSIFKRELTGFHVWRQTETQNTILSFAHEDPSIFNPRRNERGAGDGIFRMEFPLMQWLFSKPVRWGADPLVVARYGDFLVGLLTLLGMGFLTRNVFKNAGWGMLAVALMAFTPLFYYYTLNPLPDLMALCLTVWGLWLFVRFRRERKYWLWGLSVGLIALAGLVKLPYVLYMGLHFYSIFISNHKHDERSSLWIRLLTLLVLLAPVAAWYAWVIPGWKGNGITRGVLNMSDVQRTQYFYYLWYHLRTTLPELLIGWPAMILFVPGLVIAVQKFRKHPKDYWIWLIPPVALILLILFELNMIETHHDYYFMPLLPYLVLITILGARWLYERSGHITRLVLISLVVIGLGFSTYFRIQPRWDRIGFNPDWLTYKMELRRAIPEGALVIAGNDVSHHIFLYYLNRNGWVFEHNWLTEDELRSAITHGCRFMVSDTRAVDGNPQFIKYFGTEVDRFGSIRIFTLKEISDMPDIH